MSKRTRNELDSNSSSQDDPGTAFAISDIKSTSKWEAGNAAFMKIEVTDVPDLHVLFENIISPEAQSLVIPQWTDENWLKNVNVENLNDECSNTVVTLIVKVRNVYVAEKAITEMYIDGFMDSLLHILGFDDYPCLMYPQYQYTANIGSSDHKIIAKSDFSVLTRHNKMFLVIEDKTSANAKYSNNWKEDQVLGELFVAVHNIVENHRQQDGSLHYPVVVYAVRVVGTKFTFYKAAATLQYIKETSRSIPTQNKMIVQRHPPVIDEPSTLTAYDICLAEDRMNILKCFCSIRNFMLVHN